MEKYDDNKHVILITGAAGFIGAHLAYKILSDTFHGTIIGIDNLNDYYDVSLKHYRLKKISDKACETGRKWVFAKGNIAERDFVRQIFHDYQPSIVVHLAAQAGVRYSLTNPDSYLESNIIGFYNIIEACRYSLDREEKRLKHLIYASSSSVYGENANVPFSTEDPVNFPVSLYAATKKCDEILAYAYSKLYHIPSTGLRFFTVYGPAGRPDMAYFKFANLISAGNPIKIYNHGDMLRDFTYIDDVVECLMKIFVNPPKQNANGVRYKIYNIGNGNPVKLMDFIKTLEDALCKKAKKEYLPMQSGDVYQTYADVSDLERDFNFRPRTNIVEGIQKFAAWYKNWHKCCR